MNFSLQHQPAGQQTFGALPRLVLAQVPPLHLHSTLVLAVHGLVSAASDVVLQMKKDTF